MEVDESDPPSNSLPEYHSDGDDAGMQTQGSVGSDVLKSMKETFLTAGPTSFFNSLSNEEVPDEKLTNIYTERVYYGSNGAPDEFAVNFPVSKRYIWANDNAEEKQVVEELHNEFVKTWKKTNPDSQLYHKERKVFLPFQITATVSEADSTDQQFPPKHQPAEYWEKRREAIRLRKRRDEIARKRKELEEEDEKLRKEEKKTSHVVKKARTSKGDDSDSDGVAKSTRGASTPLKRARFHFGRTNGADAWSRLTRDEKLAYYKEHKEEIDEKYED